LYVLQATLHDFVKTDQILGDENLQRFSLQQTNQSTPEKLTDFVLYSDRIQTIYPTYVLDERCRIRPGQNTPVINLGWLRELLLSSDLRRNAELDWVSGKNLRFLDGSNFFG